MDIEEIKKQKAKAASLLYETLKMEPQKMIIVHESTKGCVVSWNASLPDLIFMAKVLDREINKRMERESEFTAN